MARKKRATSVSSVSLRSIAQSIARIEKAQAQVLANQHKKLGDMPVSSAKANNAETALSDMSESDELDEIKRLESDIKKGALAHPLRRITYRDISNGAVGAFIAIVNQFAFADGLNIARNYSVTHSSVLLVTSFFITLLFLYYTGFRKFEDKIVLRVLPLRAGVLYVTAIVVSSIVPFVFKTLNSQMPFPVIYGTIASISILAVLGAGTADLIGKSTMQ